MKGRDPTPTPKKERGALQVSVRSPAFSLPGTKALAASPSWALPYSPSSALAWKMRWRMRAHSLSRLGKAGAAYKFYAV